MQINLRKIISWLKNNKFHKEAQQVKKVLDEIDLENEDWLEAATEFGEEPTQDDEYFSNNFEQGNKLYINSDETEIDDDFRFDDEKGSYYDISYFNAIAKNENVKLVFNGILGRGCSGTVFKGVYNGKPVAVKIITDGNESEIEIWKDIMLLAENLPQNLKKHLPKIYKLNNSEVKYENHIIPYSIIIMEELKPLAGDLKVLWSKNPTINKERPLDVKARMLKELLSDSDYLYKMSNKIKNKIESILSSYNENISLNVNEIFKIIYNFKFNFSGLESTKDADSYSPDEDLNFIDSIDMLSHEIIYDYVAKIIDNEIILKQLNLLKREVIFTISSLLSIVILRPPVSERRKDYNEFLGWKYLPETKSLFELLNYLSENYNIKWEDLHRNNIMMGNDGNLKIIDVGLYQKF